MVEEQALMIKQLRQTLKEKERAPALREQGARGEQVVVGGVESEEEGSEGKDERINLTRRAAAMQGQGQATSLSSSGTAS